MGNVNIKLVNETSCVINLELSVLAPYYSQDFIRPQETMERSVGRVWFTIQTQLWKGTGAGPKKPVVITDVSGKHYTVIEQLAIRGLHPDLLLDPIPTWKLTDLEKCFIEKYPFYLQSPGWYMGRDRTIAIQGGPQCEYKEIKYIVGGQVVKKYFQIIDDPLRGFELKGLD